MTARPSDDAVDSTGLFHSRVRVPEHVIYRVFPGETVVLNVQSGIYHSLNPTGGRMLEHLEQAPSVADAVRSLTKEYGVSSEQIDQDLRALLRGLLERGLVMIEEPDTS